MEQHLAIRPIIRYPDPRLRQNSEPVSEFDGNLRTLARDLSDTMLAASGIGITAPHVGIFKRLTVIRIEAESEPRAYVNPEIVWSSHERIRHPEGSVSMPGVNDEVERCARVRVSYRDLDGARHEEDAEGLLAVCLQHEIDQLDGIFWLDRLSKLRRDRLIRRFEKLRRF
jgi:peptide deformylase